MSKQMIGQAKKFLGGSVIGYELGNEVSLQGRSLADSWPCVSWALVQLKP
jgi:hypothetical protein